MRAGGSSAPASAEPSQSRTARHVSSIACGGKSAGRAVAIAFASSWLAGRDVCVSMLMHFLLPTESSAHRLWQACDRHMLIDARLPVIDGCLRWCPGWQRDQQILVERIDVWL